MRFIRAAVLAGIATLAFAGPAMAGQDTNNEGPGSGQKVTICHSTGSATNPFVKITVSVNAIAGHFNNNGQGPGNENGGNHANDFILVGEDRDCSTPGPVVCPPDVTPPTVITLPGQTVTVPGPSTSVQTVSAPVSVPVVITPKRKPMKCERRFNKGGKLVIVCKSKTKKASVKRGPVVKHKKSPVQAPHFTG